MVQNDKRQIPLNLVLGDYVLAKIFCSINESAQLRARLQLFPFTKGGRKSKGKR